MCFSGHHQMFLEEGGSPQMNKFEQVSSDGHQMSQAGASSEAGDMLDIRDGGTCKVRSNASWAMVIYGESPLPLTE